MTPFLLIIFAVYVTVVLFLWHYWNKSCNDDVQHLGTTPVLISVIIAMRDEAKNLSTLIFSLERQSYSRIFFEIILVDDHSTDDSLKVAETLAKRSGLNIRILQLGQGSRGKKTAIAQGVSEANGDLLLFTDADCVVGPEWLKIYAAQFATKNLSFAFGGVMLHPAKSVFERMQQVEMASLIGSGAATAKMGYPTMCNGANMAYTKTLYESVKGFEGNMEIPSGDDEFMLHKAHAIDPEKIIFISDIKAVVTTKPQSSLSSFASQRSRWASKWPYYKSVFPKILALIIFVTNLAWIAAVILAIVGKLDFTIVVILLFSKAIVDWIMIRSVLSHYSHGLNLVIFTSVQAIYSIYVVIMALLGSISGYTWKDRTYKGKNT